MNFKCTARKNRLLKGRGVTAGHDRNTGPQHHGGMHLLTSAAQDMKEQSCPERCCWQSRGHRGGLSLLLGISPEGCPPLPPLEPAFPGNLFAEDPQKIKTKGA